MSAYSAKLFVRSETLTDCLAWPVAGTLNLNESCG